MEKQINKGKLTYQRYVQIIVHTRKCCQIEGYLQGQFQAIYLQNNDISDMTSFSMNINTNQLQIVSNKLQFLPQLDILNAKYLRFEDNWISNIQLFVNGYYENLKKLNLQKNRLSGQFPQIDAPQLQELYLGQNYIVSIGVFSNREYKKLKILSINTNQLQTLPIIRAPILKKLNLQQNVIQQIDNLSQYIYIQLRELNISKNSIQKLPQLKMQRLQRLQCQQNGIKYINKFIQGNYQQLRYINMSQNIIQHLSIIKAPKLQYIDLSNNKICNKNEIKQFISKYQYLIQFNIYGNQFMGYIIHQDDNNYDQLMQVNNEQNNEQNQIPQYICNLQQFNLINLKILQLGKCSINNINIFAQKSYSKLQSLTLAQNHFNHYQLPILKIQNIKKINLFSCQIQSLSIFSHGQYLFLQQLNISFNKLEQIPILNAPRLKYICLNSNKIKSIYRKINNQQNFNNQINQHIKINCLDNYLQLQILDISNNELQMIPQMSRLSRLVRLQLDSNKISDISEFALGNNQQLRRLVLSCNQLTKIPNLCNMVNLFHLDISRNDILDISEFEKGQYVRLQQLLIYRNRLQYMPILNSKQLRQFYLQWNEIRIQPNQYNKYYQFLIQNKFTNNYSYYYMKLKRLQLLDNKINNIQWLSYLINNEQNNLQYLGLNNNHIYNIKSLIKCNLQKINQLFIRNNYIQDRSRQSINNIYRWNIRPVRNVLTITLSYNIDKQIYINSKLNINSIQTLFFHYYGIFYHPKIKFN